MSRVYPHCLRYLSGVNRDNIAFPDMTLTYAFVVTLNLTLRVLKAHFKVLIRTAIKSAIANYYREIKVLLNVINDCL
jgi:hypothetical protein